MESELKTLKKKEYQKFRPVNALENFHVNSGPIMSSSNLVANGIWISTFSLQSDSVKMQQRKTNQYN